MRQMRTLRQDDVDLIKACDEAKASYFYRDPDRPDTRFVRSRATVPPEVKRAQGRLRTARYRADMDRKKRPTVRDVGMALATALATTSDFGRLSRHDFDLLSRALEDLAARGFDRKQAATTMRGLRNRLMDSADRAGEPGDGCGEPILSKGEQPLPF